MFLLKLLRYLRGYVKFKVKGVFIERFLNLAARDRIPIWDGRKRGDTFTGNTLASSYHKLRRHTKKTGVTMRVVEKRGAPFKRHKYRKRTGLLVGLGFFFAFTFLMSRFIWRVEVSGNERVSETAIITALDEIGVKPGRLRSSIDVRGAERRALMTLDELSWIALNIQGSSVHVAVRESDLPPPMIDAHTPCNVAASRSGQIVSMVVYSGQALKAVGDPVLEGDIIVSGITQDRVGQNLFKHARAQVKAQVQHQIAVEIPANQTEFTETGSVRNRRFLHVLGWDLPLFLPLDIPQPYRVERGKSMAEVAGTQLPVGVLSERYILMEEVPVTYAEADAKLMAMRELDVRQKFELGDAEIIDKTVTGVMKDGIYAITADYVCIMDIAKELEILKTE